MAERRIGDKVVLRAAFPTFPTDVYDATLPEGVVITGIPGGGLYDVVTPETGKTLRITEGDILSAEVSSRNGPF